MTDLEFTGERIIPNKANKFLWNEHYARYLVASHFVRNKIVLDVGCGTGYGSNSLILAGAKHVTGIDISSDAISYAKTHYFHKNLQFEVMDAISLNMDDDKFDIMIAFEIIEHLDDQERVLQELSRVLKKKGILLLSTPNKEMNPPGYVNPFHTHEFTKNEFEILLKKYFKHVHMYLQNYIFGIVISPSNVDEVHLDNSLLEGERQSQYLVSLCSQTTLPEEINLLFPTFYDTAEYLDALNSDTDIELSELKKLVNNGNYLAALEYSTKFLIKHENHAEWNYFVAFCLHMNKKYDDALVYYDKSLKMGFNEFWIRYNRGSMLVDMGSYPLGQEDLERALELNPSHDGVQIKLEETKKSIQNQKDDDSK